MRKFDFEVLIVGGGPGGLTSALALGRMGRSALVCDDKQPRNAVASHMNNFPSQDGLSPDEWRAKTRKDLEKYPTVNFYNGKVYSIDKGEFGFFVRLSSGKDLFIKKILLAHGLIDQLPLVRGIEELWGKSVFHCPYCHGFEHRNESIGLIADGDMVMHMMTMLSGLSSNLTLFTNGKSTLKSEQVRSLQKNNIRIIENYIESLRTENLKLKSVILKKDLEVNCDILFVSPAMPFKLKSDLGEKLGCEKTELGLFKLDENGQTTVNGVYACGDITKPQHSVLGACVSGAIAAHGIVYSILSEKFGH